MKQNYSIESSNAFVEELLIKPYGKGTLDGLNFAVKDNIDLQGTKTSYGSIPWKNHHTEAVYNALCIEQLLCSGATCIGKTIADEFTYSLDGESHFFGTPVNPKAPDRVPGGSSSGSASAVACRLTDFSIGTDSGGSVRVPASLCGIWGMRPSLHRISEAGVLPFMPSVSTVGAFSNNIETLEKVMKVLLRSEDREPGNLRQIYLLEDAFALADPAVREAVEKRTAFIHELEGITVTPVSLSRILGEDSNLDTCNEALRILQTLEFANTIGGWIETYQPEKGPSFTAAYQNVKNFDRADCLEALHACEKIHSRIRRFTREGDLFLFPTTPTIAPRRGTLNNLKNVRNFYNRTMAVTSFSGIGRMPEISIPAATADGAPVGISLAAGVYQDEFLLSAAGYLFPDEED